MHRHSRRGGGGGRSAGFSLDDVPGLTVHYRADSLLLNNDDLIDTWHDESGGGLDATSLAAYRPKFVANAWGSKPAVAFSGTQRFTLNVPQGEPTYIYIAFAANAGAASNNWWQTFMGSSAWNSPVFAFFNGSPCVNNVGTRSDPAEAVIGGSNCIFRYRHDAFSGDPVNGFGKRINSIAEAQATPGGGGVVANWNSLGGANDGSGTLNISIGELILYNAAVSVTDDAKIMSYLNARWPL